MEWIQGHKVYVSKINKEHKYVWHNPIFKEIHYKYTDQKENLEIISVSVSFKAVTFISYRKWGIWHVAAPYIWTSSKWMLPILTTSNPNTIQD